MRITGSGNLIPPHVARAYGVPQTRAVAQPAAIQPAVAPTTLSPASTASAAHSLVAGRAPGPITFDGVSIPRANPNVLHLYTRAADKIEAATAVHIGRTLDVRG